MSTWIISIAGICILSILVDLFLPSGNMSKYIKNIFNFFIIFVIISPIPKLINKDFEFLDFGNQNEIILQEDYIYQVNRDKLSMLETNIELELEKQGLLNIDISISADIFKNKLDIETIFVDLTNLVIDKNTQHINIKKDIIEVINKIIKIKEENIVFNE